MNKFITINDITVNTDEITAVLKTIVPGPAKQDPDYPAVSIFVKGMTQPFLITFNEAEARDEVYNSIVETLKEK